MPFVARRGARIYWRSDGASDAPALVLANSLGTDHGYWDAALPVLAQHFRVLRLDALGHGLSDAPDRDYSIGELADDVLAVAAAAGVDRYAFVGVSLGGVIGMELAGRRRAPITRLMLCNTAPSFPRDVFDERARRVRAEGMGPIVELVMSRFFTSEFVKRNPPQCEAIRRTLSATKPAGYAGGCTALRDCDLTDALPRIDTPTLVLVGSHDISTPPERGRALAEAIPHARVTELDCAHLALPEVPSLFLDTALAFLTPQPSRG